MATGTNAYRPDHAVPPGYLLEEYLEARAFSQAELARRCGRSPKLISEILAGKAPVEPKTAIEFERVLGLDASIWLGMESDYRLRLAREAEASARAAESDWARAFPVRELAKRGCIPRAESGADAVAGLLAFFNVASVKVWTARHLTEKAAYRHSPSFESKPEALATWLRLGELEAETQDCAYYDRTTFLRCLHQIRASTAKGPETALPEARRLCNAGGVALALVEPLRGTALSGATWWLSPRKAVIALSRRHRTDDHLWFSFFHEAAHLLLHSKRHVFVEGKSSLVNRSPRATTRHHEKEEQANAWAADFLIPPDSWKRFVAGFGRSKAEVSRFAESQPIAPGIVVGRLQHEGLLPHSHLNGLKAKVAPCSAPRPSSRRADGSHSRQPNG